MIYPLPSPGPPAHQWTDADVRQLRDGGWEVDLEARLSRPGMPWAWGTLRLEQNPRLAPLEARGYLSDPGKFWSLRNDDKVASSLGRLVNALASSTWRLERPELPEWLQGDPAAALALELQWEYCSRVWRSWTSSLPGGQARLSGWIRELLWTAPISGFYLGEITAERRRVALRGTPRELWWPRLPYWIAPWSVRYWLTQAEELVGVVCNFSHSTDYGGQTGHYEVVIPAPKLLHVAADKVGSNLEGVSWLRPVAAHIEMNRDSHRTEAIAERVHGVGELFFQGDVNDDDRERLEEYLLNREALHAPGGVLPSGVVPVYGTPSNTMPDLSEVIRRRDNAILTALGAEDRGIATNGGGSYAARSTASADARDQYDDRALAYCSEPLEELLSRMIRANGLDFGSDEYHLPPAVRYGAVEQRDPSERVSTVGQAVRDGLLTWTQADQANLREELDLTPLGAEMEDGR